MNASAPCPFLVKTDEVTTPKSVEPNVAALSVATSNWLLFFWRGFLFLKMTRSFQNRSANDHSVRDEVVRAQARSSAAPAPSSARATPVKRSGFAMTQLTPTKGEAPGRPLLAGTTGAWAVLLAAGAIATGAAAVAAAVVVPPAGGTGAGCGSALRALLLPRPA